MKLIIDISEDDYIKVQDGRASVVMMRDAIRNGAPLKQEQKTGHWKDCGEREPWYRCSECRRRVWGGANHYCPECGAKMVEPTGRKGARRSEL